MKVELGGVGVFMGTAEFIDNSVKTKASSDAESKRKGGAIHNKVRQATCCRLSRLPAKHMAPVRWRVLWSTVEAMARQQARSVQFKRGALCV